MNMENTDCNRRPGTSKKPYEKPTALRIADEEAKLLLLSHVRSGDLDSMEMLDEIMRAERSSN